MVVCGDFNVLPDSQTFDVLGQTGLHDLVTGRGFASTRNSMYKKPGTFADYMLVNAPLMDAEFDVIRDPEVSLSLVEVGATSVYVAGEVRRPGPVAWTPGMTLSQAIAASPAFSIAGGGDTLAAVDKYGISEQVSYISTGGGAFLEFLEGKELPAVAMLEQRYADYEGSTP